MVEYGLNRSQTDFDVAKTLSICCLYKSLTKKLIEAGKSSYPVVASLSANAFVEFTLWQKVYQL